MDRCAAAHEWMSSSDLYRGGEHVAESLHIPPASAALHLFCRVEQRQDLTYSTRELSDARYQREANHALVHKFAEGLSPHMLSGGRGSHLLSTETIPYTLWVLSAGEGSSALTRGVTSLELLSKGEQISFHKHVATLRALGLSYVSAEDDESKGQPARKIRFEPPVEQLVRFTDLVVERREIPPAVRQLVFVCFHVFIMNVSEL
jgi:chromosome transmission fidelity protein 18